MSLTVLTPLGLEARAVRLNWNTVAIVYAVEKKD